MNVTRTSAERLKALTSCGDTVGLKSAIHELCTEFGSVTSIDILTVIEAGKRRALCFLKLESEEQEIELMRTLGVSRFGNDVLVVIDLPR